MKASTKYAVLVLLVASLCVPCLAKEKSKPVKSSKSKFSKKKVEKKAAGDLDYIKARQLALDGKYSEAAPLFESALKSDPENAYLNHQLSEIYLRLANFERAMELGASAVEKDPKNLEYRANLAGIYAALKEYDKAKTQYKKILELDPENSRAPLFLGIIEAESGNLGKGADILSDYIDDNEDSFMAYFYRAKIYLEDNKVKAAKKDLETCLNLRPAFVEAGTALGLLHERMGEIDEAITAYNKIQGSGPFKKRLAQLYLKKNEFKRALEELLDYEKVEVDDYTARVKIALIYFELKEYEEAERRFRSIVKEQPEADIRFYIGAIHEEQKNYDKAINEFKGVPKTSTFYKESILHIAFIYRKQDKLKEGYAYTKEVLKKNDDVVEFYDIHASFLELMKRYKEALAVLGRGLDKFPKDEKLLYFQGAVYDKIGKRREAIASMKQIIEGNDRNAHALNFLGYTYAELGENLKEAEELVKKAIKLRPKDGFIEDSLGWVYFKQKDYSKALDTLKRAAELQPDEAVIQEHLGDVYHAKEEYEKAAEYYQKAIASSERKQDKEQITKIKEKLAKIADDKRIPSNEKN